MAVKENVLAALLSAQGAPVSGQRLADVLGVSRAAVWASFIVGVGLTTGNMIAGFVGTAFIASPINCGAIAMVLSLVIVPVVSLFTKRVDFEVDPPRVEGAIDREYEQELEAE